MTVNYSKFFILISEVFCGKFEFGGFVEFCSQSLSLMNQKRLNLQSWLGFIYASLYGNVLCLFHCCELPNMSIILVW